MGETISHDRIHWMYHDLTVILNKDSPTLQISVYYLSRERRGNEKKKRGNGRKLVFKLGIMGEVEGRGGRRRQGTATSVSFSPVGANLYAH